MSNSTFATRFYSDVNKSYSLKVDTVKLAVTAQWLRQAGCTFTTYSDRKTKTTKVTLKTVPSNVVEALIRKFGFFNAKSPAAPAKTTTSNKQISRQEWEARFKTATTKTTQVPASSRPSVGTISREEWLSRFRSNDSQAVAQPKARKIRNADELPRDAVVLKPIAVVVPQLCLEDRLYNKEMQNGVMVVTGTYTCRTVQLETEGFLKAVPLTSRPQTNSDLAGGVSHQTATVASTEVTMMPGCATTEQLMSCTLNQLYKFAQNHNIKGRSSLKAEKNKAALVEKLLGLVKKSSI